MTMRLVDIRKDMRAADFARAAAQHFAAHPSFYTYADGDPKPGELMAVRWNSFTVLVLEVGEDFEPSLYDTGALGVGRLPNLKPIDVQ